MNGNRKIADNKEEKPAPVDKRDYWDGRLRNFLNMRPPQDTRRHSLNSCNHIGTGLFSTWPVEAGQ